MKSIYRLLLLLSLIIISSATINAQIGLGVRIGDPTAVTIKKYTGNGAFEFNIGYSPSYYSYSYYNHYYDNYYGKKYPNYRYDGYGSGGNIDLQAHYLIQKDIHANIDGKFQWYFGGGLQFRSRTYYVNYHDNNGFYYSHQRFRDIDFGLDGVIGAEYTFDEIPLTLFADTNIFIEVVDYPYAWWQLGIGARYNFSK